MSALIRLRDYQTKAIEAIHTKWDAGIYRPAVVLPTGAGKTVVFTHLAEEFLTKNSGRRVLVLAHTDELVNQAARKMREVSPGRSVGIVKAAQDEVHAEVVVASVQSLRSKARRDRIRNVGLIIVDECFPAGTLVGGRPIESLKPGDMVPSWDEETGQEVMRPVVALMRKVPARMVRVTLEGGVTIDCTPNHPILTTRGWCPAGLLSRDDLVVSFTHDATAKVGEDSRRGALHGVRGSGDSHGESQGGRFQAIRADVLPDGMSGHVGEPGLFGQDGADEPGACLGADEGTEPHEVRGEPREDESDAARDRASAAGAWREREADTGAATEVGRFSRMAYRGDGSSDRRGPAVSLQDRYRPSDDEGVRRGGRGIPFLAGAPRVRPAAGRAAIASRVAGLQVLEPGSDGTYGGVCRDGAVYNIEVAGTHTYLIGDGIVVHNCHHGVARTYRTILEHFGALNGEPGTTPVRVVGFTATLVRSDNEKLSDVWEDVAFRLSIAFMIRAGYLLDVRGKHVKVPELDLKTVKQSGGDYQDGALGEALIEAMAPEIVAKAYVEHASDRKGLIFAPTVDSAYAFEKAFSEQGIVTETVHGALRRDERRAILGRLKSGETQVVANCMVLTEGFDEPTVSCVVAARPTKSSGLWQQIVGRVLRPDLTLPPEDRGHALILDVTGVSKVHGLQSLVDLSTRDDLPEDLDEDLSLLELEDLLLEEPAEEVGAGSGEPPVWYVGPAETRDFDPLGSDTKRTWGKTPDGTYYLPAGTTGYVLLADSVEGEPGTYDVVWCDKDVQSGQRYVRAGMTEHRGLSFELALAWAEEVATERGGEGTKTLTTKKAKWRKEMATSGQVYKVRQVPGWGGGKIRTDREPVPEGQHPSTGAVTRYWVGETGETFTKGMAAEIIDGAIAARAIDPLVQFVKQRQGGTA